MSGRAVPVQAAVRPARTLGPAGVLRGTEVGIRARRRHRNAVGLAFSTGSGGPVRRRNNVVTAISTNHGNVSEDLMNRSLPVHLAPTGNVSDRVSPIGNPKMEYLPRHREQIQAELRGLVARWQAAGRPLDESIRHPMTDWARTIGGILRVNGFTDFLQNYGVRRTADDPLRQALGLLG